MKILLVIIGLAGLAIAESHVKEGSSPLVKTTSTGAKKPRTFRAALHDAMGIHTKDDKDKTKGNNKDNNKGNSKDNKDSAAEPRIYFEVIRVNERVVVNEQTRPRITWPA